MTRFRSIEQPPTGRSVSIELNGHAYEGTYTVNGPMLSLDTLTLGVRRGRWDDYAPEVLTDYFSPSSCTTANERTAKARRNVSYRT